MNEPSYNAARHIVVSNASCTTNALAPVAKVLHQAFGIEEALFTTVHAYTNGQRLLDAVGERPRRGRSAAANIVPATTGAAVALGLAMPELADRITGLAFRVPTTTVSALDITLRLQRSVTRDSVNTALRSAAEGALRGILAYSEEPLVSSDLRGDPSSAVVSGLDTTVLRGLVKVVAWYDNEYGYSCRAADLASYIGRRQRAQLVA